MAISSINSGASNPYLDQNTKQADNTKQSNSTATTSTGSANQANLDASYNDKANTFSNTDKQSSQTQTSNSVAKDSQFAASFQKSQLLSKLPNNSNSLSNTTQETSATSNVSATKDLGDYGHLSTGQKKLIDDLNNRQNAANKTQLSPEKFYNDLQPSQKSTFESVTNALENTTIIGKNGSKTNALDTIESVDVILGEKPGSKDGKEQFRLLVTLKDGSSENVKTAKNFIGSPGHGSEYPHGRQLKGGEPSLQFAISKDGKKADIDVDYEVKTAEGFAKETLKTFNPIKPIISLIEHFNPSNSDVRHSNHFEKHNERFASEPDQQPLVKKY